MNTQTTSNDIFTIKTCFMDRDHWRVHWHDDNKAECFNKRNYNGIDDLRHVLLDRCNVPMAQQ